MPEPYPVPESGSGRFVDGKRAGRHDARNVIGVAVHSITGERLEALVWFAGLVYLAIHNPYTQTDFTFCPFKNLGFEYCPGCGLGRSVSFLLHGDIVDSFRIHILGIPAVLILVSRIVTIMRSSMRRVHFRTQS